MGKLLRRLTDDPGSTGSDDPSFQYPPVPGGDLSVRILMPGGPAPFDVDDEDMPPGHSNDPPGPATWLWATRNRSLRTGTIAASGRS